MREKSNLYLERCQALVLLRNHDIMISINGVFMRSYSQTDREDTLQITIPAITKKSLRLAAAENGETMRVIVLRALASAGIEVPKQELKDRRKGL